MGEPIKLKKGKETITVHGRGEAAVYLADGWKVDTGEAESEPEKPKAARPPAKKAGK